MNDARVQELKSLLPQCLLWDWVRLGSRLVRLLRDHHHAAAHDAVMDRLLAQARESVEMRALRAAHVPLATYPPDLPITARKDDIVAAIRAHQVVVIAGETGSGKTTQIPKMCLEAGLGIEAKIGCTQPRRVAAVSISQRIAEELQVGWGREIGCKIRFDDRSGDETYIKLMTDGILLAEVQGDPLLTEYNAIILDEAHERSLNIDFLLGYLKGLLKERPDLKLLITSATIDTQTFSKAFDNAPIIEVSGRMYPVEVLYRPIDAASEERGEITFVDAAVQETERVFYESSAGDVLIFMPGERDIRETSDQLEGCLGRDAEIIPLYGRLSTGDQQRVFSPSHRRKVIVATNIAETSLTIPGIRYVIDAGLARMSRYNPRTRTRRLPVEPVSQSSANQRKGRAGRVQDGVCIRLYSEEDFASRPPFTQPEIQRANLAEVILRMKAFRLGEIETFPFVNPPSPASIAGGYALLQELGALDEQRQLTQMGRDLARLPIDPTLGRMLLQSQVEHATRELLIIASGLSVQDPRERPLDQREAADAAHRRYSDPRSDFLSLLKLWDAVHDEWEKQRTQNLRRRFCRTHFLSYLRMREWQDLHAQLHDALDGVEAVHLNESNAEYEAVHRSILSGLLGHAAHREERNGYKAGGNRLLTLFPGSALYDRGDKNANARRSRAKGPDGNANAQPPKEAAPKQPEWIVAGEIVETSQLFARTVAGIDPEWIVQIAPHLCKVTHHHPHWSAAAGRVLIEEKVTFQGLEVRSRRVAYASVNPKDATTIFIRSALVEESMDPPGEEEDERGNDEIRLRRQLRAAQQTRERRPARYPFLEHNRTVREKIENWQTRVRRNVLRDVEQALFDFYSERIENVSSLDELDRLLRDRHEPGFLCVGEEDLTGGMDMAYDAAAFPDAVPLGGQATELRYAYAPGEEHDGVTVRLNVEVARSLAPGEVEWSVPGLRSELVMELLRALPKSLRRDLMPLPPKVEEIVRDLKPTGPSLLHDLAAFIRRRYAIDVQPGSWAESAIPAHLRPRVEVLANDGKVVGFGRDLGAIREQLPKPTSKPTLDSGAWARAARQWERFGLTGWSFGDLPVSVLVEEVGGLPVMGWPGLAVEENGVSVRLFRGHIVARRSSLEGIRRLIEQALQKDFAWVQRDLRSLAKHALLYVPLGDLDDLVDSTYRHLRGLVLPAKAFSPLSAASFNAAVEETRNQLRGVVPPLVDRIGHLLELRRQVAQRIGSPPAPAGAAAPKARVLTDLSQLGLKPKAPVGAVAVAAPAPTGLHAELAALLPPRFPERYNATAMGHLPRYLKALLTRAERASQNPAKEQERIKLLAPYADALRQFYAKPPPTEEARYWLNEFRWMVEEYKVSLFAQELGTAQPVSPKRLDEMLLRVRNSDPIP